MLVPQEVKVFERWKGCAYWDEGWYYHVRTWLGPKWINLNYTLPVTLEPAKETVEVKTAADLHKYPWLDSYTLGKIAPQKVTAFERGGGWYHIHFWTGDAWITNVN